MRPSVLAVKQDLYRRIERCPARAKKKKKKKTIPSSRHQTSGLILSDLTNRRKASTAAPRFVVGHPFNPPTSYPARRDRRQQPHRSGSRRLGAWLLRAYRQKKKKKKKQKKKQHKKKKVSDHAEEGDPRDTLPTRLQAAKIWREAFKCPEKRCCRSGGYRCRDQYRKVPACATPCSEPAMILQHDRRQGRQFAPPWSNSARPSRPGGKTMQETPRFDDELKQLLIDGIDRAMAGRSIDDLEAERERQADRPSQDAAPTG